jgi:radical SAM superfamily enzyme YgiQ (UPF0313 family)
MYKGKKFEAKETAEIKADVREARRIYGAVETLFLGDSDNLVHKDLSEIVAFIRKTFPEAGRITSYARARTVLGRKPEWLRRVRQSGLDRLHLGLESGDAVVLERLLKGAAPEDMIRAGQRAAAAGFEVSFYVLNGAGGRARWREHARESARVLNRARPRYIRLRTLTVQRGTPLDLDLKAGRFEPLPPRKRLLELRLFIECLEVSNCTLASDHLTNYLWSGDRVLYRGVAGTLPENKEFMLRILDAALERLESPEGEIRDAQQLYREGVIENL